MDTKGADHSISSGKNRNSERYYKNHGKKTVVGAGGVGQGQASKTSMDEARTQNEKTFASAESVKPSYIESNAPQLLNPHSGKPKNQASKVLENTALTDNSDAGKEKPTTSPGLPPQDIQNGNKGDLNPQGQETPPDSSTTPPDFYDLLEVPEGKPCNSQRSQPQPAARLNDAWWEDDSLNPQHISTSSSRPITTSSRGSNVSSIGTIPEFPVPGGPSSSRNPHSSLSSSVRRGPSSHYSQPPDVAPIAEEPSGPNSHGSYASSMAVPIAIAEEYSEDEEDEGHVSSDLEKAKQLKQPVSPKSHQKERSKSDVEQRSSEADIVPPLTLMTKAIKDKTSKESVRSDTSRHGKKNTSPRKPQSPLLQEGRLPKQVSSPNSDLSQSSILFDPSSSSESDLSQARSLKAKIPDLHKPSSQRAPNLLYQPSPMPTQMESPYSPSFNHSPLGHGTHNQPRSSFGDRFGNKRPPQLNVSAARGVEGRNSLTSLPDMIWRATKLAANLERGRTASTFGVDHHLGPDYHRPKKMSKSESIKDMLASFPPPALGTPTLDSRGGHSPSRYGDGSGSGLAKEYRSSEKGMQRKCCGMPRWLFLALLLTIILVISVVVVIVVVLVIIPENDSEGSSGSDAPVRGGTACERQLTCSNGGSNVVMNGECRCLCVNNFTGANCQTFTDEACTTIDVEGTNDVTVGGKISEVIEKSRTVFNIPLNASIIVGVFSKQNTTCTSQNTLVSFDSASAQFAQEFKALAGDVEPNSENKNDENISEDKKMQSVLGIPVSAPGPTPTSDFLPLLLRKRAAQDGLVPVTKNGLVFAGEATAVPDSGSDDEGDDAGSTPSDNDNDGDTADAEDVDPVVAAEEQKRIDFAQLVILFVMQTTQLFDAAVDAQQGFQEFFDENEPVSLEDGDRGAVESFVEEARNVTLGGGVSADLIDFAIAWPDGKIGGADANANANPNPNPNTAQG